MKQNLIMVEYAAKDSRSVAAMLLERGDGREKPWIKFQIVYKNIEDQLAVMEAYANWVSEEEIAQMNTQKRHLTVLKMIPFWFWVLVIVS